MRPQSKTFKKTKAYLLSAEKQNKLLVPRGFLHAFAVPSSAKQMAYFNYYCDNIYCKESEVCVSPKDVVIPALARLGLDCSSLILSSKDMAGMPLDAFAEQVLS